MRKTVTITLEENDLGQIIDGLSCRLRTWETTERAMRGEDVGFEPIEDCNGEHEASRIAATYRRILSELERHLNMPAA